MSNYYNKTIALPARPRSSKLREAGYSAVAQSSGASQVIVVDAELSEDSTNPVQNRAIYNAVIPHTTDYDNPHQTTFELLAASDYKTKLKEFIDEITIHKTNGVIDCIIIGKSFGSTGNLAAYCDTEIPSSGGSGLTEQQMWNALAASAGSTSAKQLHASHLTKALGLGAQAADITTAPTNGQVLGYVNNALAWVTPSGGGSTSGCIPLAGSSDITGSLVPAATATNITLGTSARRWNKIYASSGVINSSLELGDISKWNSQTGLSIFEDTYLYGNVCLGDDDSTYISIPGLITSSLISDDDGGYDIGSPSLQWGTIYAKDLVLDGTSLGPAAFKGYVSTVIRSSTSLVTSGAVYAALDEKQDALDFDITPTPHSQNPVTSGGVYNALLNKLEIGDVNAENLGEGVFLHSMYYSHHPEASNVSILPFLYNDLAGADIRTDIYRLRLIHTDESQQNDFTSFGIYGSEYDSEASFNPSKNAMFDCSPSYFQLNKTPDNADLTNSHTAITVLDIVCLGTKYFNWSNRFYVDFGNASWSPKTVELYVAQANARSGLSNVETAYTLKGTWQKANDGGNSAVALFGNTTHRGRGDNDGVGFDRIRFVFYWGGKNSTAGRYMNYLRIAQVGLVTYNSSGAKEGFVSRNYDTPLYCNLNPAINGAKSIGTASNKWGSVYANTFYGALSGNATTATIANTAQTMSCNAITSGTIDNQGYEYQKVKWYSYIAKPAIDNASKGFATNSYANGILALCTYPRENASYYHRLAFSGNGRIYHQSIANGSAGDWREIINASDSQTITGVKTIDGSGRIKLAANAATGAATGKIVDNDNRTVLAVDTTGDGAVVLGNPGNARPLYIRGKDVRIYGGGISSIYGIYVGSDGRVGIGGGLSSNNDVLKVTGNLLVGGINGGQDGDIVADGCIKIGGTSNGCTLTWDSANGVLRLTNNATGHTATFVATGDITAYGTSSAS